MDRLEIQSHIDSWERAELTSLGRVKDGDLVDWGFPFERGDYVPVDQRYSAMLACQWIRKAQALAKEKHYA